MTHCTPLGRAQRSLALATVTHCLFLLLLSLSPRALQMQGSAAVNTKADQLEARHVHVREADLPESFHVHAVADVQREVWTRKWVRRLEEERYAIPLQIDSERINWQKRLQQRNDRAAVRRRDEQQMREAKEKCDEEVQEAMADKDEADKRIKSQKVAARELKV